MKKPSAVMRKRKAVKAAMALSLAAVVVSGFCHGKTARRVHVATGIVFTGLCVYHNYMYPDNMKS